MKYLFRVALIALALPLAAGLLTQDDTGFLHDLFLAKRAIAAAQIQENTIFLGKQRVGGKVPTATNCTIDSGSTDYFGSCASTAGAVTVTFSSTWTSTPKCIVNVNGVAGSTMTKSLSATAITLANVGTTGSVTWLCMAP